MARKKTSKVQFKLPSPDDRTKPSDDLSDYSLCLFGLKGAGKSVLASCFPRTINLRFEQARRNLTICQFPDPDRDVEEDPETGQMRTIDLTWGIFQELMHQFWESEDYDRFVIDSADAAWKKCKRHVLDTEFDGVDEPDELGDQAWHAINRIKAVWEDAWRDTIAHGKKITWISHAKDRKQKDPSGAFGGSTTVLDLTLEPRPTEIIKELTDLTWLVQKHKNQRILTVRAEDLSEIQTQIRGRFFDPDGEPVSRLLIPDVPADDDEGLYQFLESGWDNELRDYFYEEPKEETKKKKTTKKRRSSVGGRFGR